jgi:hypothetical protein
MVRLVVPLILLGGYGTYGGELTPVCIAGQLWAGDDGGGDCVSLHWSDDSNNITLDNAKTPRRKYPTSLPRGKAFRMDEGSMVDPK